MQNIIIWDNLEYDWVTGNYFGTNDIKLAQLFTEEEADKWIKNSKSNNFYKVFLKKENN